MRSHTQKQNQQLITMAVTTPPSLDCLFPVQVGTGLNPEDYRHEVLFGKPELNITGILNHPEIPRFFACNVSDFSIQELRWYKAISSGIQSLKTLTMGVESPDSLLLPYRPKPSAILLNELRRMNIKNIEALPELSKEFMPFGDTALLYTKDASKIEIFVSQGKYEIALYRPQSLAMVVDI